MENGNIGISTVNQDIHGSLDAHSRAYEAARDRGDTLEAARAVLQKIGLMVNASLGREAAEANRDIEESALLQKIKTWVEDGDLPADDVIQNLLQAAGASSAIDIDALDSVIEDKLNLDLQGFKSALENDRDALENKIITAVKMSSTHSTTLAMAHKDLLYQHSVLMSLYGELTDQIKSLKSTVNSRG